MQFDIGRRSCKKSISETLTVEIKNASLASVPTDVGRAGNPSARAHASGSKDAANGADASSLRQKT